MDFGSARMDFGSSRMDSRRVRRRSGDSRRVHRSARTVGRVGGPCRAGVLLRRCTIIPMKTPNLPSLAASFFLFVGPALAQSPEPPSAAPGAGAASTPLAEILPRSPAVSPIEALARSGAWADLKVAAQQLLAEQAPTMKTDPAPVVAAFALLALANAGSGDPSGGICRWQAAQILDPRLRQADLSAYGEPGRLLQANPVQDNVSAHETQKGTGSGAKRARSRRPRSCIGARRRCPQPRGGPGSRGLSPSRRSSRRAGG
jgi:hypothetical protein